MNQSPFGNDDAAGGGMGDLFGDSNNNAEAGNDEGAGWADAFGEDADNDSAKYDLNFARVEMKEVLGSDKVGSKQKKSGLQVNACVNYNNAKNELQMELQFTNQSGGPITGFDLMVNKNSFGVCPNGPCTQHGITYPAPFATSEVQALPLKIDKKNADVKAPPKHPFLLQVALKSSLDIFYFSVPVYLHSLISREPNMKLTKDEFKKFWEMIGKDKEFIINIDGN